jgi:AraC-like DNA-binding protein
VHKHTIWSVMPDPCLRPFVRCFAQREMAVETSSLVQTVLAALEPILGFHFSGQPIMDYWSGTRAVVPPMHVLGTQTRSPGCLSFTGCVLGFGIFLKPFASWELFRILPAEFADQEFQAREVFGPWITDLWLKLAECDTFCDRVRVATEALLPFAEHASLPTRTMAAAQNLFQADFGIPIQQLAHEACMSIRTYERKFVEELGLSPKLFARLRRFQTALDRKRTSGTRWLDVAHDSGYFDQMHMVKEFRVFGRDAPSRLLQRCGDWQPWSIGAPLSMNDLTSREIPSHSTITR